MGLSGSCGSQNNMTAGQKYGIYALFGLACICVFVPLFAHAQQFVPLADVSQSQKLSNLYGSTDFSNFINGLFKFAIAVGAIVAVLRLVYAGYLYMGQSDMWSHKGVAKGIIGEVTLGLLLLLAIYLILYQINPDILTLKALRNITPVQQTQTTQTPSTPTQTQLAPNVRRNPDNTCTSYDEYGNAFTGLCP